MSSGAARPLTERQQAVMERIDRRVPIKVIAQELGVSETRINQHIRALKDIYEAANLGELVESYRADNPPEEDATPEPEQTVFQGLETGLKDFSEAAYGKNQVPMSGPAMHFPAQNDPGELVMSDVLPLGEQAPWLDAGEPRVVSRVLDGDNAVWFRLVAIVGIAFGFLAAVVLTMTAAYTISKALEGRAAVPVDESGFS